MSSKLRMLLAPSVPSTSSGPRTATPVRRYRNRWAALTSIPLLWLLIFYLGMEQVSVFIATTIAPLPSSLAAVLVRIAQLLAAIALLWVGKSLIGGYRSLADDFHPKRMGRELGLGLAAAAILFGLAVLLLIATGVYRYGLSSTFEPSVLPTMLVVVLCAAATEEVLYRAGYFGAIQQLLGSWCAIPLSGLIFGVAHLGNAGATIWTALCIAVFGMFFAALYLWRGSLWMAISLHTGWNLLTWLFGTNPGNGSERAIVTVVERNGPEWLTGGAYGLEGSAVTVILLAAATAWVLRQARRQGRIVPLASWFRWWARSGSAGERAV